MESRTDGLGISRARIAGAPVTLYQPDQPGPLAVVAHGFAGSRQMMDQIAVTLARSGFTVAAFDFPGHGRNAQPMSADVTRIEGTTEQLVQATLAVTDGAIGFSTGQVVYVGHSMATDIVIRAAAQRDDVAAVAAVSMYSEAITKTFPQRLLIISGAREAHLRAAGLEALALVDGAADEGETVVSGDVQRRAVVAPNVGHLGVLFSATTLAELRDWLADATGLEPMGRLDRTGWIAGLLLASLVLLALPLSALIPRAAKPQAAPAFSGWQRALLILWPAPLVLGASYAIAALGTPAGLFGVGVALALWGAVQLGLLWRLGTPAPRLDAVGTTLLLAWGLGVFALALDRYGAAFLPVGPRLWVMLALLPATLIWARADAAALAGAGWATRLGARFALLATLGAAMALAPASLGLSFSVLPVLACYFIVYGGFARLIEARRGSVWVGTGVALAWAIAASTPVFAT